MLNPMSGRNYQGYLQANQSVLEEEEDEQDEALSETKSPFRSSGDRRVSWGESSRMNVLRHNQPEQSHALHEESSDDEVPQSFMIETNTQAKRHHSPRQSKGKGKQASKHSSKHSVSRPILPVTSEDVHLPPRPSEIDPPTDEEPQAQSTRKQMRGLDAYERALWNWVNVYDLDVFLQDVYRYYEGKGIISIALARGLHLLYVIYFTIVSLMKAYSLS